MSDSWKIKLVTEINDLKAQRRRLNDRVKELEGALGKIMTVNDLYLLCKSTPFQWYDDAAGTYKYFDHRDIIISIVEKCHKAMTNGSV